MNNLLGFKQHFSKRIKELRMGKSQVEFSGILDVPQSKISVWENLDMKDKYPSIEEIFKIAEKLEVSPISLFFEEKPEIKNFQPTDNVDMLNFIAEIMNRDDTVWEAACGVSANKAVYANDSPAFDVTYEAAICTKDYRFGNFIHEYDIAISVGRQAARDYGVDADIAESMKKAVIEKYKKIFEEDSCTKNNEEEILDMGSRKFVVRGEKYEELTHP